MSHVTDLSFRLVDLPCYHVAMARSFGESPEIGAWSILLEWAERCGLEPASGDHRFFGFNDPPPARPSEPYGYQQWMTVDEGVEADPHEDVAVIDFAGGRYATIHCEGIATIGDRWRELYAFVEQSELTKEARPGLEELLTLTAADPADYVFDLYLPVEPA